MSASAPNPTPVATPVMAQQQELVALFSAGRYLEVEQLAQRLTVAAADNAFAWKMLGAALLIQAKPALSALQRAAALLPDDAEVNCHLGSELQRVGRLDEAVEHFRRAVEIRPDYAEAHNSLGAVLRKLGRLEAAAHSYRRAVRLKPNFAAAHSNLGSVLRAVGRLDDAVRCYRRALVLKPDFAEAHNNLAVALRMLGRLNEAVASYQRALALQPDYAVAHNNLGAVQKMLGRDHDALASYRRALEIQPDYAQAHSNLGLALQDLGRHIEAAASYRQALSLRPDYAEAFSNLLFCLTHDDAVDAPSLYIEHCQFGRCFEPEIIPALAAVAPRDPERRLRVGFVSADFRTHPVMVLFEPVVACLARMPELEIHAYSNHVIDDEVTARIRHYCKHWSRVVGMSDADLAEQIRADQIDILIDLSGHTAGNRLLTFALKPAPLQASWIGYPGTTGLKAVDYYFADHALIADSGFAAQFVEQIVYLPAAASFMPSDEAPPINPLPALERGHLTFGSFNRISKLSPRVIAVWSRLLRALPESTMLIGAIPEDAIATVSNWFSGESIAPQRLRFYPRCDMKTYLSLHHQVDICLDAFPYNGATTSGHALWMGVPTLTMAGATAASRAGATFLSHIGLDGFVARDADEFFRLGLARAADMAALAQLRREVRARCAQSALCQPTMIAAAFQRALRVMWRRYCDGLPAESFDA